MTYYTCEPEWEAILTCIYEAWDSGKGHKNIKILKEPVGQMDLFGEYIHVEADPGKAEKVASSIKKKISYRFYHDMAYAGMAYEEDAADNIYHCLILGFAYGSEVLDRVQFRDIMRNKLICTRVEKEIGRFQEFLRFHQTGNVYVAHIEPKSRIVTALGPIFEDRMPSEHWMIIDDVHRTAVVHPKDEPFYLRRLSDTEFERLQETEQMNDRYTDLWKVFFGAVAIEERKNEKLQTSLYPKWTRKHAVEFF